MRMHFYSIIYVCVRANIYSMSLQQKYKLLYLEYKT